MEFIRRQCIELARMSYTSIAFFLDMTMGQLFLWIDAFKAEEKEG